MSLAELLPMVRALPPQDRQRLLEILRDELEPSGPALGEPGPELRALIASTGVFPVYTPLDCYEAAAALQRLSEGGAQPQ